MNKTFKRILIGAGILLIVLLLAAGGIWYKFTSETAKMTPVPTGKVTDHIYAVKDAFANMYLLQDGNKYIAVDAGKDMEVVASELKKLNINPDSVTDVLLTHSDMDHVAAVPLFKMAKIYLSRNELDMLNGKAQKIPGVNNKISRSDFILLDDRQTITLGNEKSYTILTAGHTTGSMCFLVNDKYLFTGDMLSLHAGKIGPSVKFFDLDHDRATKSIAKITKLPGVEYIFTAHFGFTGDYQKAVKDWKE